LIKVISFDLDDTLCDTQRANKKGLEALSFKAKALYPKLDGDLLSLHYNNGIHRRFSEKESELFLPITCEETFRLSLIEYHLKALGVETPTSSEVEIIQTTFDDNRIKYFDFYPDVKNLIIKLRQQYKIIVITNGPTFSQYIKIETVNLKQYVDHILVGGEEPHQKPHASIFDKALNVMGCDASEAIHIGDSYECDIVGAFNVGIKSVWITDSEFMNKGETEHIADYVVSNVLAIDDILVNLQSTIELPC
jgi:HAD superfamily hydrolase (TIGR01549 family)